MVCVEPGSGSAGVTVFPGAYRGYASRVGGRRARVWLLELVGLVPGWGCPYWYTTAYYNDEQVSASGVLGNPDYGFGRHAWSRLSGPAGSAEDDSGDVFGYSSIAVHAHVNYGVYDGTYLTTAEYHHVIPPAARLLLAQQQQPQAVPPYVQIWETAKGSGALTRQNGSDSFTAQVKTSVDCRGPVTILGGIVYATDMQATIEARPPGANGSPHRSGGGLASHPMSSNSTQNLAYTIRTGANNQVVGFIGPDAWFHSHPAGCTVRGPVTGQSTGQQYTVHGSPP